MKKIVLLIGILFIVCSINYAQDFIYLKDGSVIQGTINEVNIGNIIYTNYNNPEGSAYSIKTEIVSKIVFANGYVREFGSGATQKASSGSSNENEKDNYFALATGWGISYGGAGIRAQVRFGKIMGFGLHGGLGYFPAPDGGGLGWSLGAKFFYYRWLYLNVQGGVASYQLNTYDYETYYPEIDPSVMLGGDFIFGDHFGFNAAVGRSFDQGPDYFNMDLGFVFKF